MAGVGRKATRKAGTRIVGDLLLLLLLRDSVAVARRRYEGVRDGRLVSWRLLGAESQLVHDEWWADGRGEMAPDQNTPDWRRVRPRVLQTQMSLGRPSASKRSKQKTHKNIQPR